MNNATEETGRTSKVVDVDDDGGGDSDDSGPDVIFDTDSDNEVDAVISKKPEPPSGTGEDQASLVQAVSGLKISTGICVCFYFLTYLLFYFFLIFLV